MDTLDICTSWLNWSEIKRLNKKEKNWTNKSAPHPPFCFCKIPPFCIFPPFFSSKYGLWNRSYIANFILDQTRVKILLKKPKKVEQALSLWARWKSRCSEWLGKFESSYFLTFLHRFATTCHQMIGLLTGPLFDPFHKNCHRLLCCTFSSSIDS